MYVTNLFLLLFNRKELYSQCQRLKEADLHTILSNQGFRSTLSLHEIVHCKPHDV